MTEAALLDRVRRLERQVRLVVALALALLSFTLGSCAIRQDEVSAKWFFVKDKAGKVRVSFGGIDGEYGLSFIDQAGRPMLVVQLSDSQGITGITMKSPSRIGWESRLMPEGLKVSNGTNSKAYTPAGPSDQNP